MTSISDSKSDKSYRVTMYVLCWISGMFAGIASTLMPLYLTVITGDIYGTSDTQTISTVGSYVSSLFLLGWTFGGILLGLAADKVGRVRSLIIAIVLFTLPMAMASFVRSLELLTLCRFLTGAGIGATLVITTTFIAELWNDKSRATALGFLANSYAVGIVCAGLINYLIADWHTAFVISSLPVFMVVVVGLTMKESSKWHTAKVAADNKLSQINQLFHSSNKKNFIIGTLMFGTMLIGLWAAFSWLPTWVQSLLAVHENGQQPRGKAMMLLGMGGIVGTFFAGFVSNWIGRKKSMLISFAGCFLAATLLFKTNSSITPLIFIETGLLSLFFGFGQGVMTNYIPELFPTLIRATATGLCFNIGRIATAIAVFFVGMIVIALGGYANAVSVFSYAYLVGFIVTFFAKETKGVALPE
ncbi:MAG: MFS transporter [Bacteroidetes bacterium]|nr:MFS transporter [Bacteroidota bacterium]